MADRLGEVRSRVEKLRALDPKRARFGASQHGWELRAPLGAAAVADLERRCGGALPAEYRAFLLEVASAGAGPGYGLREPSPIELDEFPRVVTRVTSTDGSIAAEAGTPKRPAFGLRSSPARPFPLRDRFEPLLVYDLPAIAAGATPYDGCIQLCDHGCGYFDLLVVNGPLSGQVWSDTMAAVRDGCMAPTGLGFLDWYGEWLDEELAAAEKAAAATQQAAMAAAARAQAAVATAGDDDPVIFPGAKVARLSDYVAIMKGMQRGDMMGALSRYGLDIMAWGSVAAQWGRRLASDPALTARFTKLLTS